MVAYVAEGGEFERDTDYITTRITADGRDGYPSPLRTRRDSAPPEHKHSPDELHGMVEDMITLLESSVQPELRKGRYPDRKTARRVSEVVKAVARELDA